MLAPGQVQLVSIQLGGLKCAARIDRVEEVVPYAEPTRVPNTPAFVEGMIDLRGRVVPVVCLRKRFGVTGDVPSTRRIVIVRLERGVVGFLVDRAGMARAPVERILPPPAYVPGFDAKFLSGVVRQDDGMLLLLDLDKVLTSAEAQSLPQQPA